MGEPEHISAIISRVMQNLEKTYENNTEKNYSTFCMNSGRSVSREFEGGNVTASVALAEKDFELLRLGGEPKLIHGLPDEAYHALPFLSSSQLRDLLRSPLHFKTKRESPKVDKEVYRFGRIAHFAQLQWPLYESLRRVSPNLSAIKGKGSVAAKETALAEFEKSLPAGAIVVTQDEHETITRMVDAVQRHKRARQLLSCGASEVSGFCFHPEAGEVVKIRTDYLRPNGVVVEYKTCQDASLRAFTYDAKRYDYHTRCGFYLEVLSLIEKKTVEDFVFIAQEKEPPYAIMCFVADESFVRIGKLRALKAMRLFKDCREKNIWPGYPEDLVNLSLPAWASEDD